MKKFLFIIAVLLFSISTFAFAKDECTKSNIIRCSGHYNEPMVCIDSDGERVDEQGRLLFPVYDEEDPLSRGCLNSYSVECKIKEYTRNGKPSYNPNNSGSGAATGNGSFTNDSYHNSYHKGFNATTGNGSFTSGSY